ncbi:MAG: aminotransferase class I/II-fold pyridoxal phosphate-dependent enzyme [Verrucomicrobia bacterium]|nr:aminotransferase class I/II-fold pyridoxal phosphate-dependent enzyme [Verrucomicrobiota bacterium]
MSTKESGDVPVEEFRQQLRQLTDWIVEYRANIEKLPVAPAVTPGEITRALPSVPPNEGEAFDAIFADFKDIIVPGLLNWAHPEFLAYFGCTTTAPGVLGEIASAALNVNAMTWRTSPAATELETVVIDWLRQWLLLPAEWSGVVFDTASIGIMHALCAAREEAVPDARTLGVSGGPALRIYTSDQAHSSVEKAAIAIGVGEENVVRVPTDESFRMRVEKLRELIARDLSGGMRPLAVVATCGTTSTASVDPVNAIADVCHEYKIWLHIDAAYGGGLALLPEEGAITEGWARADSLIVNPHKMLFVPFDFSVLYLRDLERLRRVFTLVPEYLRGDTEEAERNYMDYGVPLGRRFRALKAWMVFRTFGREGIAARIREHMRLARLFGDWVSASRRWELSAPVSMGVVCFRAKRAPDDFNSRLVEEVNHSGRAYLTQTKLRGRTAIRLGLGNILTTENHVRAGWELICQTANKLAEKYAI